MHIVEYRHALDNWRSVNSSNDFFSKTHTFKL